MAKLKLTQVRSQIGQTRAPSRHAAGARLGRIGQTQLRSTTPRSWLACCAGASSRESGGIGRPWPVI